MPVNTNCCLLKHGKMEARIGTFMESVLTRRKDIPSFIDVPLVENEHKENVRVVKKEIYSKICFPTRFDEIDILAYENIDFVDIGQAKGSP